MTDHILIIEDEKDLILTLEYTFKKEGYKVTTASTGEDGIRKAVGKNSPNIILLDLMLTFPYFLLWGRLT